ncbi:MAG: carboxypeptidase M32 [Trueperaceae bacterium]|nr:carboxypeptidase M32 [Trueperaceae bacterium]MCC6310165.1 carboxypeptidase M32 [Trueperaceae bacterium]MCO5174644.1 carboxypeptidase M32 [Trueperaceae bacterium]MCW5819283.1 carboxypeptidase M32 [Trueperaceae bacterium]
MRDVSEALRAFRAEAAILSDLAAAADLLSWDQDTYMPPGAAAGRGEQEATLHALRHGRLTDPAYTGLLDELEASGLDPAGSDHAMVRVARRTASRAGRMPRRLVEELARRTASARVAWAKARSEDRFDLFAPELAAVLELKREEADAVGGGGQRYDALLDEYEPGATAASLAAVFEPLKEEQVALLAAIAGSGVQLSDEMLRRAYPVDAQRRVCEATAASFGYDFRRGRLDVTAHPFAIGIGADDVRITTRYDERFLNPALFGTMHEAGHAMYEQGFAPEFHRTPLAHGASLGIHESQSRLWENLIGRSLPYWEGAFPALRAAFPEALGGEDVESLYAAVNRVESSLIRVEADEVSYNLHILVRFELELALLNGDLAVKDLPAAWNDLYRSYLGITPPSDALGCLQDIHWAVGLVGYFPTYALGNLVSAQLFAAARGALPELDADVRSGDFATLLGWLRSNVHRHGSRYLPAELIRRATGSELDSRHYVDYLKGKYGALYGLA